jgi:hypothetical protein
MRAGLWAWLRAACDTLVAVAAVLLIVAPHWVWFRATLTYDPNSQQGWAHAPSGGPATGVYAHPSLWAVVGLAAVQVALLAARYYPGGRLRVPGDSTLLAVGSVLMFLLVAVDYVAVPSPWIAAFAPDGAPDWDVKDYLDGAVFVMTRTPGATIALKVALASLAFAVASLVVTKAGTWRSNVALRKHQLADDLNTTS